MSPRVHRTIAPSIGEQVNSAHGLPVPVPPEQTDTGVQAHHARVCAMRECVVVCIPVRAKPHIRLVGFDLRHPCSVSHHSHLQRPPWTVWTIGSRKRSKELLSGGSVVQLSIRSIRLHFRRILRFECFEEVVSWNFVNGGGGGSGRK